MRRIEVMVDEETYQRIKERPRGFRSSQYVMRSIKYAMDLLEMYENEMLCALHNIRPNMCVNTEKGPLSLCCFEPVEPQDFGGVENGSNELPACVCCGSCLTPVELLNEPVEYVEHIASIIPHLSAHQGELLRQYVKEFVDNIHYHTSERGCEDAERFRAVCMINVTLKRPKRNANRQ